VWHSTWITHENAARCRSQALACGLALTQCAALTPCAALAAVGAVAAPADQRLLLLAVSINELDSGDVVAALPLGADEGVAVAERHLAAWRLSPPAGPRLEVDGEAYVRLNDIAGVHCTVDSASQTLAVRAPASAFVATSLLPGGAGVAPLTPSRLGGFLNYDVSWQRSDRRNTVGGLFELGAFGSFGSATSTAVWTNSPFQPAWVRLDTTWVLDMPERLQSLRIGDVISRPGIGGRSVRFGGIQWATNFSTQPGFVNQPQPTLHGEAVVPSTLDVFIDNVRLLHGEVPPGPFDLTHVPVPTGGGEMQLVVRDALGRQQLIVAPYYTSRKLLKPGLHDFSYEAGAIREDYGRASAEYGRYFLAADDRVGLTPRFTGQWRAELLKGQQTAAAGGSWFLPRLAATELGTLNFGAAFGQGRHGHGGQFSLGVERQTRGISFGLQAQQADRGFVQIGQVPGHTQRRTIMANLGFSIAGTSIGLSHLRQSTWEGRVQQTSTASVSQRLGPYAQLGLYALHNRFDGPPLTVGAVLSIPLGANTSLSADSSRQGGHSRSSIQLQANPPTGEGLGWRMLAGDDDTFLAATTFNAERATLSAEWARIGGHSGQRVGAAGGIASAEGAFVASRRIDDGFAFVKVADFPGVRIYRDHQVVARTDERGRALVPRLRAYEKNALGIEQEDLPVEAEVDTLEINVTPALRSGIVVDFPVRRIRAASFRLTDEHGADMPPGTSVRAEGDDREFPVGFAGQVFVSRLKATNRLSAQWAHRRCRFDIDLAHSHSPISELGTLVCKAATP